MWKSTGILSIFGMVKLVQLQVKCKRCGHKMYITRKLLGVEPQVKVPQKTVRKLGLLGALTIFSGGPEDRGVNGKLNYHTLGK